MKVQNYNKILIFLGMSLYALTLSGCGKTAFDVLETNASVDAPGSILTAPKVDFLLVEDDTGSMSEAYSSIAASAKTFTNKLFDQGWNTHFAVAPLTTYRPLAQVTASQEDGNWGSNWKAPYPGAPRIDAETILSSVFRFPSSFTAFLTYGEVSSVQNGNEPGLSTLQQNILTGFGNTNFRRPDGLLVILIVGNGNDNSFINYCPRPGQPTVKVPCEYAGQPACIPTSLDPIRGGSTTCASMATGINYYQNWFRSLGNIRVYAAVANQQGLSCLGGTSLIGDRYQAIANATGGKSYDVCSLSMDGVFSDLPSVLHTDRVNFRREYIVIPANRTPTKLVRYVGGDPKNQEVVSAWDGKAESDGWEFAGYVPDQYMIDYPSKMNKFSGWAIRLHGNSKFIGDDQGVVSYEETGAVDSISN